VLAAGADSAPEIDFNAGAPTAQNFSEASGAPGAAEEEPINLELLPKASPPPPAPWRPAQAAETQAEADRPEGPAPGLLPFVADAVAFVLLVVAGLVVGELLVRKPTGEVLSELAAPKFPPVNLLMWAAPAVLFALVYLLLSGRGLGLGALVRRGKIASPR
jgi:hypothetical protein